MLYVYDLSLSLCRAQLQREKQAREDAERQRIELQERLKQFEQESKKAQEGKHFHLPVSPP